MEDCCHVWDGVPSCYLELLDKLQRRTCKTVGPSLVTSLEPFLAHRRNVASLSLFYRHYFGRCSSELAQLVPLPFSRGGLLVIMHDFFVTISTYVYVNSFLSRTATLWNSLPVKCFALTYDLNGFKPTINRHLLTAGLFLNRLPVCFDLFVLLFLATLCLVVAAQSCMEWISIKKRKNRKSNSNVSVWCRSQKYLFGIFSANYYQSNCDGVYI